MHNNLYKIEEEAKRIELHSNEVNELLGRPPNWFLKWGTLIIIGTVVLFFLLSNFIQYPDKISGTVRLENGILSIMIKSDKTGYINEFFVEEGDVVQKGEVLMSIQNNSSYNDIKGLRRKMEKLSLDLETNIDSFQISEFPLSLGSVQNSYAEFLLEYNKIVAGKKKGSRKVKKNINSSEKRNLLSEISEYSDKLDRSKRRLKGLKEKIPRLKTQLLNKEITVGEYQNALNAINYKNNEISDIESKIKSKNQELRSLKMSVQSQKLEEMESEEISYVHLQYRIDQLIAEINKWENDHIIRAPLDGVIEFLESNTNQHRRIEPGDELLSIKPENHSLISSKSLTLFLREEGYGKVKEGQRVFIKFDSYPFQEFGTIVATIEKKASLKSKMDVFPVKLKLVDGLTTNFGNDLPEEPIMTGQGEVLTDGRSLFDRVFEKIEKAF